MNKRWFLIIIGLLLILVSLEMSPFISYKPLTGRIQQGFSQIFSRFSVDALVSIFVKPIELEQPNEFSTLLDGRLVSQQWEGVRGRFVVAVLPRIPVYVKPDQNSEIIHHLNLTERVRIVFKDNEGVMRGPETGYWVFLKTENGQRSIGWVLDFDLGYRYRFKPIPKSESLNVLYSRGDVITSLNITTSTQYIADWFSKGQGIKLKGTHIGRILAFKDSIVIIRNEYAGWFDFFYRKQSGEVRPEWKFRSSYYQHTNKP